jgi:CRP/FNR family transcriptional regulator, cyclic AMP receptor protein
MTVAVHDDLRRLPAFAHLPRRVSARADALTTWVSFAAGDDLCRQGELGREAFVLLSGTAVVTRDGQPVAEVGRGDVVGEAALLGGHYRNATVTATTEVTALVMSAQEFASLMALPDVGETIRALTESHRAAG